MIRIGEQSVITSLERAVLEFLKNRSSMEACASVTEVSEISIETGIKDNDDVLRALYTLEGKNLVSPDPKGDFTSSRWAITDNGMKATNLIEELS